MIKQFTHRKGFTLIEMLIVIAIIGILASIVLVGIGPVQRQARDSRRAADLRQVQNALELCFSKTGSYPPSSNWAILTNNLTGGGSPASTLCGTGGVVRQVPATPSGAQYEYAQVGTGYVLAATLEDTASTLLANDIDGTVGSIACDDASGKYCIQF